MQFSRTIKLLDAYGGQYPDRSEAIWEHVGKIDFEKQFGIVTINPAEWFITPDLNGQTPKEIFEECAEPWQKELVQDYRNKIQDLHQRLIVVEGDYLVDGLHRMTAFALEGVTEVKAIDLCENY